MNWKQVTKKQNKTKTLNAPRFKFNDKETIIIVPGSRLSFMTRHCFCCFACHLFNPYKSPMWLLWNSPRFHSKSVWVTTWTQAAWQQSPCFLTIVQDWLPKHMGGFHICTQQVLTSSTLSAAFLVWISSITCFSFWNNLLNGIPSFYPSVQTILN